MWQTISVRETCERLKTNSVNGLTKDEAEEIKLMTMLGDPTKTLCQCLWYLMESRNWRYPEKFNEETELHKNYHGKIKNNKYNN